MKKLVVALLMGILIGSFSAAIAEDACCPLSKNEEAKSDSTAQAIESEQADQIVKDEAVNSTEEVAAVEKE